MMRIRFATAVGLSYIFLTGCSMFGPVKLVDMNTYTVNTVPPVPIAAHTHPLTVYVAPPDSAWSYNTTQMMYSTERYQVDYFAKNRWSDTPAQMLQSLMVQSLQNTHYFSGVSSSRMSGRYDYVLYTQLIDFKQVFHGMQSAMHITLRAQWVNGSSGKVIASKTFSIVEPAPENSPYGGVVAANKGVSMLLARLVRFCLQPREV
jgi:cholesterol transport system auxiliary component